MLIALRKNCILEQLQDEKENVSPVWSLTLLISGYYVMHCSLNYMSKWEVACELFFHDRIISLREDVWAPKTGLIRHFFLIVFIIKVPVPREQSHRSCIRVTSVSILHLFRLDVGTVSNWSYVLVFILIHISALATISVDADNKGNMRKVMH